MNNKFVKILINILIVSLLAVNFVLQGAQKTKDSLIKEIIVYQNDSIFRHTYFYDSNNNLTAENNYKVIDNFPNPISRIEWVYSNGLCVSQLEFIYDANWILKHKIQTSYVGKNKERETYISVLNNTEIIYKTILYEYVGDDVQAIYSYLGEDYESRLYKSVVYTYDIDNKLLKQLFIYNIEGEILTWYYDYKYNEKFLIDSLLVTEIRQNKVENLSLTRFFYNQDNQLLIKQIQKKWNDSNSSWINQTKIEYKYNDDQNLIEEFYFHFTTSFWSPNSKYEYVYDNSGLLFEKVMYQPMYKKWRKIYTIVYSTIEKNKPSVMESRYNFWGGENDSYVNNLIPFYFNDEITIMQADKLKLFYTLQTDNIITKYNDKVGGGEIYPNPSNGVFYISTDKYRIESWTVHSMSGQFVKSKHNTYHTGLIDISELVDGIYILRAQTAEGQEIKQKVVIQRSR